MGFAENLKNLRQQAGLTQPELAEAIGVSNGMISFWENGVYQPTATNIIKIARYFHITSDELLSDDDDNI